METWAVTAGADVKTLGLTPHLPPGQVFVISIEDGGWAHSQGIQIGDEIVALNNGLVVAEMDEAQFRKLLQSRPLMMTLREGVEDHTEPAILPPRGTGGNLAGDLQVVAEIGIQTLGLTPQLPPGPAVVLEVAEGGWANKVGIQVGDEIVALNEDTRPVAEMSTETFMNILRSRPLRMTLRRSGADAREQESFEPELDTQESRRLRAQEIEAKREAAIKEKEEKRKGKEERDQGSSAQQSSKTGAPNKKEVGDTNKLHQDKDAKGKLAKDQSESTRLKLGSEDSEKHSKDSVEAKREAAIKEREARRKQNAEKTASPQKAKEDTGKSEKEATLSPRSAPMTPTTAATTPADIHRGGEKEGEPPAAKERFSAKREIESAKRRLATLERERERLDLERKRRENEVYKNQFEIDEAELESVRMEEREARLDIMREEAEAQLRIEVAEDMEREEAERKMRIEEERKRLLQGGTLEEREDALKKLHELEEQNFDFLEATRIRAKTKHARMEETEKRKLLSESVPPTDLEIWQRDQAKRESILDRISATEDARRLEEMLAKEIEDATMAKDVTAWQQGEDEEEEISKADCIKQRIIFNQHREQMNQEKWKAVLRSNKGKGYPADKDGRLERRRRHWGTKQAMRPEDRVVDKWEAKWRQELENDAMWRQDRRRMLEVSMIIEKQKPLAEEQIRLVSRWKQELSRLTLLKALGGDTTRCHNCDLNLANMKPLLRALQDILSAVCTLPANAGGKLGRDLLPIVANALRKTAHIDPKIAELASCMPKEVHSSLPIVEEIEAREHIVLGSKVGVDDLPASGKKVKSALAITIPDSSEDLPKPDPMKESRSPRANAASRGGDPTQQQGREGKGTKSEAAIEAREEWETSKKDRGERSPRSNDSVKKESVEAKREAAIKEREARKHKKEGNSPTPKKGKSEERGSSPSKKHNDIESGERARNKHDSANYDSVEAKREAAIREREMKQKQKNDKVGERSANANDSVKYDSIEAKREAAIKERDMKQQRKNDSVEAKREAAIKEREARQDRKEGNSPTPSKGKSEEHESSPSQRSTKGDTTKLTKQNNDDNAKADIDAKREAALLERERRRVERDAQSKDRSSSQIKQKPKDTSSKSAKETKNLDVEAKREAAIKEREAKRMEKER